MNKTTYLYRLLLISLISVLFLSCKSKSKLAAESDGSNRIEYRFKDLKSVLNNQEIGFKTLNAQVKLSIDLDKKMSAKATLRMEKDKSVWMSISYFGLEVARLKMDEDRINILDKINKKHYTLEYDTWNKKYGTEFTITHFQKLLLGLPVENISRKFDWSQNEGIVDIDNKKSSNDLYWLFYQINQSTLTNQHINTEDKSLFCEYSKEKIKSTLPKKINVNLTLNSPVKVEMKANKVELNKSLKMPFKVSSKYAKVIL